MAMDKEKLLAYFQDHYLSRQEVLFKLPLRSVESWIAVFAFTGFPEPLVPK